MLKSIEKMSSTLVSSNTHKTMIPNKPSNISGMVFFQIKPFKDNDRGIGHRDTVSKNLISLKRKRMLFLICGNMADIKMYVGVPPKFKGYFQNTFFSSYPTSDLIETQAPTIYQNREHIVFSPKGKIYSQEDFTRDGTYMDPMNPLFSLFNIVDLESQLQLYFSYTFKHPRTIKYLLGKAWKLVRWSKKSNDDEDVAEKKRENKPEIFGAYSYKIISKDQYLKEQLRQNIRSAYSPFISNGKIRIRSTEHFNGLTHQQAGNFFHIPTVANFIKGLEYGVYRKLPYPTNLPTNKNTEESDLTVLGNTDYRWEKITFGIKKEDKFRHMYIVGKTGTGKSVFLSNMIISDMKTGNGLCLLDPHGELVDAVLEHIPTNRINDVILFDVADSDFPIGFNLLQAETEDGKNLIASGVVTTFKRLFGTSRGPRLEYILRNVVLSLVEYPNATLMHILRILTDKNFREEVVSNIKDTVVMKFWMNEFNKRNDKQREEAVGPITNKVGQFLSSKLVRNIFGQPRTKLNMRKAMDEGKIILVNLSKGRIGEDNANMIGSLLVTKIQIDAMSRADIPAHMRRDFYLYIDEFQNFASESFVTVLSEARKYKLSLIVANQYTSQLLPEIKDAIFGNVGTTISFTVGKDDADIIAAQFKEMVSVNDLISLPKYTTYTRLMIDGISSDPFSTKTLAPNLVGEGSLELIDKIRKQSRQRYAMQRNQLEKLMDAWSKKTFSLQEKIAEKARYEALGLSTEEAENLQNPFVLQHESKYTEYEIEWIAPDAIIFDTDHFHHKAVRYNAPQMLDHQATIKYRKGQKVDIGNGNITMHVDIYQHQTIVTEGDVPLMIRIGKREDIIRQMDDIVQSAGYTSDQQNFLKYCPNVEKLQLLHPETTTSVPSTSWNHLRPSETTWNHTSKPIQAFNLPVGEQGGFSIQDIKLGERYEWYIKLSYNYGMFVTVKWVEWLLHKNFIVAPDGVDWKKYYNIWDKIKVKAKEFKEINGEKKVVRSLK